MDTVTVYDEEFDQNGNVTRSVPRTIPAPVGNDELRDLRLQVRAIARNEVPNAQVPAWGRVLARAIQVLFFMQFSDDAPQPVALKPRQLDADGYDIP